MKKISDLRRGLASGRYDGELAELYFDGAARQKGRYDAAAERFSEIFGGDREALFVSAPGRCELSGNHTDHQNGCVLAAAVTLDSLAVASASDGGEVRIVSEGFGEMRVDLSSLSVKSEEKNRSEALVRGVAAWFQKHGYAAGGFDAYIDSEVPKGSGLSSSACYEVLIGNIFNALFHGFCIPPAEIAQAGRFAENVYFQKPSGLMDQMACALGGIIEIDFRDGGHPAVTKTDESFSELGYDMVVVNSETNHVDLSDCYAGIPNDMKAVAAFFHKELLREVPPETFYGAIAELRKVTGDRAVVRAHHFFCENDRVQRQIAALNRKDAAVFIDLLRASGYSSGIYLGNLSPDGAVAERGIPLALAVSEHFLGSRGASRVHGGGFAGTILSIVPNRETAAYIGEMERFFGRGCCYRLAVRRFGGYSFS